MLIGGYHDSYAHQHWVAVAAWHDVVDFPWFAPKSVFLWVACSSMETNAERHIS